MSNIVVDSPNKIFIGGLPTYLNEEQVRVLLSFPDILRLPSAAIFWHDCKTFCFREIAKFLSRSAGYHMCHIGLLWVKGSAGSLFSV